MHASQIKIKAVADACLAAWGSGDLPTLASLSHVDSTYTHNFSDSEFLTWKKTYVGHAGLGEFVGNLSTLFIYDDISYSNWQFGESSVSCDMAANMHMKHTGKVIKGAIFTLTWTIDSAGLVSAFQCIDHDPIQSAAALVPGSAVHVQFKVNEGQKDAFINHMKTIIPRLYTVPGIIGHSGTWIDSTTYHGATVYSTPQQVIDTAPLRKEIMGGVAQYFAAPPVMSTEPIPAAFWGKWEWNGECGGHIINFSIQEGTEGKLTAALPGIVDSIYGIPGHTGGLDGLVSFALISVSSTEKILIITQKTEEISQHSTAAINAILQSLSEIISGDISTVQGAGIAWHGVDGILFVNEIEFNEPQHLVSYLEFGASTKHFGKSLGTTFVTGATAITQIYLVTSKLFKEWNEVMASKMEEMMGHFGNMKSFNSRSFGNILPETQALIDQWCQIPVVNIVPGPIVNTNLLRTTFSNINHDGIVVYIKMQCQEGKIEQHAAEMATFLKAAFSATDSVTCFQSGDNELTWVRITNNKKFFEEVAVVGSDPSLAPILGKFENLDFHFTGAISTELQQTLFPFQFMPNMNMTVHMVSHDSVLNY